LRQQGLLTSYIEYSPIPYRALIFALGRYNADQQYYEILIRSNRTNSATTILSSASCFSVGSFPASINLISSNNLIQHDAQFTNAHYAGYTRRVSHDQLAVLLADFARRANFVGVQTQYSRIPVAHRSDRPDARGDIFFPSGLSPLAPNQPFVLDVRLSHIFTRTDNFRSSLLSMARTGDVCWLLIHP